MNPNLKKRKKRLLPVLVHEAYSDVPSSRLHTLFGIGALAFDAANVPNPSPQPKQYKPKRKEPEHSTGTDPRNPGYLLAKPAEEPREPWALNRKNPKNPKNFNSPPPPPPPPPP